MSSYIGTDPRRIKPHQLQGKMPIFRIGFQSLILLFSISLVSANRIDPAGISGSLVLSAENIQGEAVEEFSKIAGKDAVVLIISLNSSEEVDSQVKAFKDKISAEGIKNIRSLHIESDELVSGIKTANAIWLVGDELPKFKKIKEMEAFRLFLSQNTVLGAGGKVVHEFTSSGIFPDAQIVLEDSKVLQQKDGKVLYRISKGASLILSKRSIRSIGEGEVLIVLKDSEFKEKKTIKLKPSGRGADLTALRFAAADRNGPDFPKKVISPPRLDKGSLIIIGGGPMPRLAVKRFIQLAGGNEASIVVLPTAVPDSMIPQSSAIAKTFEKFGPKEVTVLPGRKISEVDSEKYLNVLRKATGIWFGGGRQWNFVDAYHDTKALKLMHNVLDKGGVIMGSSAGASIQAEYLVRGNPLGNRDMMAEGYEKGLGFLSGVAIDQHFAERDRFKDLSSVIQRFPQLLGIGIDEGTALIVNGSVGTVQGKGQVHFYDRSGIAKQKAKDYESVGKGGRYQLVQRKVLNLGEIPDQESKKQ